jgi:t-SNARE complex subunit (syntaxin)
MEDQARQLRQEIESIQSGSGSILRRGQELRENIAKLESVSSFLTTMKNSLNQLINMRAESLDKIDKIRAERFRSLPESS